MIRPHQKDINTLQTPFSFFNMPLLFKSLPKSVKADIELDSREKTVLGMYESDLKSNAISMYSDVVKTLKEKGYID